MAMTFDKALDASPIKTVVIEESPPTLVRVLSNGYMKAMQKLDGKDQTYLLSPEKAKAFRQEACEKKYKCRPLDI